MDFFIPFITGVFLGTLGGFFLAALVTANAKDEEEPSGVDDVLDEITERSKDR